VLAPATAAAIGDIVLGGAERFDFSAFSLSRFAADRGNRDYALQRETPLGKIGEL
jgi:glycine/D-amino acid oxidase-like deaminating enzyme